jgi:NADPH2:quinone reductase
MKAVWYERSGDAAEVLNVGDMPDPEPGPGEVRVKIAHSAVNPTDAKRRRIGRELARFPRIIPNNDGSGVIDAVGEDVPGERVGARVWTFGAQAMRPFGTAADYCVLPDRQAVPLPDGVPLENGACLGVPAVTAHHGLFADGDIAGKTVLVTGAAGRVGQYAVQMAKWAGATVIATAGSAEKVEFVRGLGADHAFNYRDDDVVAGVREITGGKGVHRIVEVAFGANVALASKLVRANGVIATYGSDAVPEPVLPFYSLMYAAITIRPFAIFVLPRAVQDRAFADVNRCLEDGALRHHVGARFAFDDMAAAHDAVETDAVFGTALVTVGEGD